MTIHKLCRIYNSSWLTIRLLPAHHDHHRCVCVCVIGSILICTQGQVNRSVREDKRLVYKTKCVSLCM